MPDPDDQHEQPVINDPVDDSVVADPDTEQSVGSLEMLDPRGSRVALEPIDGRPEPMLDSRRELLVLA